MSKNLKRSAVTGLAVALVGTGATVATASSANADVWDRVAACESGGNWGINTGNGFSGGLQFTPSTWRAYGGSGSAQHASKAEQIRVAKKVLASQGPGAWPVCSRKAGLTRAHANGASGSVESSRSTTRAKITKTTPVAKKATPVVTKKVVKKVVTAKGVSHHVTTVRVPAKAAATSVAPSLRTQVKLIQRELDVRVDGVVGPQTARVIQKYVGVEQDGIIGPKTVAAIEKKVGLKASGATKLTPSRINALAHYLAKH